MKNLTSSNLDGSTCIQTHFSRGFRISRSHKPIWPVASTILKMVYGHEERARKCSLIWTVQLVSRLIFQGESKSEEGNLKFSLSSCSHIWDGQREGWVTFLNLDDSIFTQTYFLRRVRISRWDLHNWPVACDTAKVVQGVEERCWKLWNLNSWTLYYIT